MSQLYPKYNPETYLSRDLYAQVCATGDLRPVWAKSNSLNWGVEYEPFLVKCLTHCPCCGSKLNYGLGKNNHGKKDFETPSTDHLVPQSIGGTNDLSNGQVLCLICHKFTHSVKAKSANSEKAKAKAMLTPSQAPGMGACVETNVQTSKEMI